MEMSPSGRLDYSGKEVKTSKQNSLMEAKKKKKKILPLSKAPGTKETQ